MIDHNLLHVGNIFSFVFYYWRLFLDETIKRQDIICVLSQLQLYTAAKTIARTLCRLFFIPISGSRCHERLAPTRPPLSLRFIFFDMWPTSFVIFHHSSLFFFTRSHTMRAKGIRARKRGRKGETERRRETRITRKRKWDTTGPHCPDEWVNGQWRSTLKK